MRLVVLRIILIIVRINIKCSQIITINYPSRWLWSISASVCVWSWFLVKMLKFRICKISWIRNHRFNVIFDFLFPFMSLFLLFLNFLSSFFIFRKIFFWNRFFFLLISFYSSFCSLGWLHMGFRFISDLSTFMNTLLIFLSLNLICKLNWLRSYWISLLELTLLIFIPVPCKASGHKLRIVSFIIKILFSVDFYLGL